LGQSRPGEEPQQENTATPEPDHSAKLRRLMLLKHPDVPNSRSFAVIHRRDENRLSNWPGWLAAYSSDQSSQAHHASAALSSIA
jgi:hypothetical protein